MVNILLDELFTKLRIYNKREIIFSGYKNDLISLIKYNLKKDIPDENISIKELIENYCPEHWTYKETKFEDIDSSFDKFFIEPLVKRKKQISNYFNKKINKNISKEFVINELTSYLDNNYKFSDEEIEMFGSYQSYIFYKNDYLLEEITPYLTFISFPDFKDYQSEIKFYLDFDSSIKNDDLLLLHFKNETYIFYKILIDDNFWYICKKASDLSESTRKILFTESNQLFQ